MKFDEKKKSRLRDQLPVVDISVAVRERKAGREWFRVDAFAKSNNVSTTSVLNWIKSGKLEGCTVCGMIHARKPLIDQGGQNEETNPPTTVENQGN